MLRRRVRAVESFSMTMFPGEVIGLAGPNGAGKSTLIALMLGFMRPTRGRVRMGGVAPRSYIERNGIGYLSELVYVPTRWRTEHALRRYALLAGVPADALEARVEEVIDLLGLAEHRRKLVRQLSKGNLQRLGLGQALLADEHVLVLDEPTHGLDPVWTQRFRDVVTSLRRADRVIVIASHNLDELQRLADRVAIIDGGQLQRIVATREGGAPTATPYRIVVAAGAEHVTMLFRGAVASGDGEFTLPPMPLEGLNAAVVELVRRGGLVRVLAPTHSDLEQQFREAVHVS